MNITNDISSTHLNFISNKRMDIQTDPKPVKNLETSEIQKDTVEIQTKKSTSGDFLVKPTPISFEERLKQVISPEEIKQLLSIVVPISNPENNKELASKKTN